MSNQLTFWQDSVRLMIQLSTTYDKNEQVLQLLSHADTKTSPVFIQHVPTDQV